MSGLDPNAADIFAPDLTRPTQTPVDPSSGDFADGLTKAAPGYAPDDLNALKSSWAIGSARNPDQYAKTLKTAADIGFHPDLVEAAPQMAEQIAAEQRFDPTNLALNHPALASWLSNPENASVSHDDLENLSALDFAFKALPKAFGQGVASAESGLRKAAKAIGLPVLVSPGTLLDFNVLHPQLPDLEAANEAAIKALDLKASEPVDESNLLKTALVETARFAPILAGSVGASFAAGPEAGAGILAGYFGVTGYGASKYKMAQFRDENGQPIPEPLQQMGSIAVGGVDAALGLVEFTKILKVLPGAKGVVQDAADAAVGKLLTRPTFAAALKDRIARFGEATVAASLASAGMTAAQMLADAATVAASGQKIDLPTFRENMGAVAESAYTGALIGLVTGGAGLAYNLPLDGVRSARAKAAQRGMVDLGAKVQESKVLARAPGKIGDLAAAATEAGDAPEHVFMPVEAFTTLFQTRPDITPEAAAANLGVMREYAEAKATGGDVAIPFSAYVEKIAGVKAVHDAAMPDLRFDPGDPTPREAAAFDKAQSSIPEEIKAIIAERGSGAFSEGQGVYDATKEQLLAAGTPEAKADYEATIHQAFFRTLGGKLGQSAEDVSAAYPLSIVRAETDAPAPKTLLQRAAALFQAKPEDRPFGSYTVETGGATIRLSASDNLATFLHETGHHFLRITADLAAKDGAPEAIKADHQAILDWLGAKDTASLTVEQHEKFADGFLTYLREGKAPTLELASAFARFRAWLSPLIGKIVQKVDLNPDVRDVFRRMLASDAEITQAEIDHGFTPLFESAAAGRMTDAEFSAYQTGERRARAEARAALLADIHGQVERETKAWWKEEEARVRANVEAEFGSKPEYIAADFLRTGRLPEGAELPPGLQTEHGTPLRLDPKDIERMYGPIADTVKGVLGRTALDAAGVHPDVIAEQLGFGSGREMIDTIIKQRPSDSAIRAEVTRRMVEAHGDILADGTISDRAADVVHKVEARQRQLLTEERMLRRAADRATAEHDASIKDAAEKAWSAVERAAAKADRAAKNEALAGGKTSRLSFAYMRNQARELIGGYRERDINPKKYAAAERSGAQKVAKLMASGDYAGALEAQRARISAFAMYLEASAAKVEGEKAATALRSWDKDSSRAVLGKQDAKTGSTYLDQQDKMLERFDIRKGGLAADDKRQSLSAWMADQVSVDLDPAIPEKFIDETFRTHWKNLTHDDLMALHDAVENIRTQATRDRSILVKGQNISKDAYLADLKLAFDKMPDRPLDPSSQSATTTFDTYYRGAAGFRAILRKIEEVCLQIDGGQPSGPAMRGIFQPMADSEVVARDHARDVLARVQEYTDAMPKELRDTMREKIPIPDSVRGKVSRFDRGAGLVTLTRSEIMRIGFDALGNPENYQRLLRGGNARFKVWNEATIKSITDLLTREQLDYMQGMGDTLATFWPEIEAQRKRLTGNSPTGVAPVPFTRKFADGSEKSYSGWYFPLVDDPAYSRRRSTQVDPASDAVFSPSYARALPTNTFAHARVEGYVSPLSMEMNDLPAHIANVIHDLSHREALISVRSILSHPDVKDAMRAKLGVEQQKAFMPWLQYIANKQAPPVLNGAAWLDKGLNKLRTDVTIVSLGFRFSTAIVHSVGWVQALDMVPAEHMASATKDYFGDVAGTQDWIHSVSGAMRHLSESYDRDLSDAFDDVRGKTDFKSEAARFGMLGLTYVRKVSGDSAFLGAYRHAMTPESKGGLGLDHAGAVEWGESVARRAVGAGGPKDLAPIQRGSALAKFFTMFYSWGSTRYQRLDTLAVDIKKQATGRGVDGGWGPIAARSLWLMLIIPAMSAILKGRMPNKDDEESYGHFLLDTTVMGAIEPIPVARDFANALERGSDVQLSPVVSAVATAYRAGKHFVPAFQGDYDPAKEAINFGRAAGYATGYPVDAPLSSIKYLWDLETGDEDYAGPLGTAYGVAYGRSPQQ